MREWMILPGAESYSLFRFGEWKASFRTKSEVEKLLVLIHEGLF